MTFNQITNPPASPPPSSEAERHRRMLDYLGDNCGPLQLEEKAYAALEHCGLRPAMVDFTLEQLAQAGKIRIRRGWPHPFIQAIS